MDVHFFFCRRVAFIRQLYENAAAPFIERKRRIEAEEEPFKPPYSEDGEPPFVAEWSEADESLHVLGYTCVSMLSAALHLYFQTWEQRCRIKAAEHFKSEFKNGGWVAGYRAYCLQVFSIDFGDGPCDLKLIEEIVLARNRAQHPDNLVMTLPTYTDSDMKKLPRALFIDNRREIYQGLDGGEREWLMPPTLHVSSDKLSGAISEVERFVAWLDPQIEQAVYQVRRSPSPEGTSAT
jgi:hypothetical protein